MPNSKLIQILIADDDPDDRMLMKDAMEENSFFNPLAFVEDGEDLLYYLYGREKYEAAPPCRPGLIFLDLNMPKVSGWEALREIRSHPTLKSIPVVILTTSRSEEDVQRSYELGVNSFISKPGKFKELVEITKRIGNYWFNTVSLPNT